MSDYTPGPDDRRTRPTMKTPPLSDERVTVDAAPRSSGTTIAGVLLVVGLILLGLMFLTPSRTPTVNNPATTPTGTATAPSTTTPSTSSSTGSSTGTTSTTPAPTPAPSTATPKQ